MPVQYYFDIKAKTEHGCTGKYVFWNEHWLSHQKSTYTNRLHCCGFLHESMWVPSVKKFLWLKIIFFRKISCIQIINECIPFWMLTLIYDSLLCSNILNVRLHNLNRSKAKSFYKVEDKFRNNELMDRLQSLSGISDVLTTLWIIKWPKSY